MKKSTTILFGVILLFSLAFVTAENCALNAEMINQDPYPAIPGDYVKVVFQLNGIGNPNCGNVDFSLVEGFPFKLKSGQSASKTIRSGTYTSDYKSSAILPYELIVNEDALDGMTPIEVKFSSQLSGAIQSTEFDIQIEDVRTDFEISIKDYILATNTLTFEILNTGKGDAEALTIEIPQQDTITVKGSNRNIIGSLDSNEDTSFSFEAIPTEGDMNLEILYTDGTNARRTIDKKVHYNPVYFTDRIKDTNGSSSTTYLIIAIVVILIIWFFWRRNKKKNQHK